MSEQERMLQRLHDRRIRPAVEPANLDDVTSSELLDVLFARWGADVMRHPLLWAAGFWIPAITLAAEAALFLLGVLVFAALCGTSLYTVRGGAGRTARLVEGYRFSGVIITVLGVMALVVGILVSVSA